MEYNVCIITYNFPMVNSKVRTEKEICKQLNQFSKYYQNSLKNIIKFKEMKNNKFIGNVNKTIYFELKIFLVVLENDIIMN